MKKEILVEVSARHVHLSDEHLEVLFGKGHTLTNLKELSQPGQYATAERVSIKGPKSQIDNVIILGPTRSETQVEVSATEARMLGIKADIRMSGDIENTQGATIIGPKGSVEISEGVIIAKRHIHLNNEEAENFNLVDKQKVMVKIPTENRSLIFDDVIVRVSPSFSAAMHIDTDEGNAANVARNVMWEIL